MDLHIIKVAIAVRWHRRSKVYCLVGASPISPIPSFTPYFVVSYDVLEPERAESIRCTRSRALKIFEDVENLHSVCSLDAAATRAPPDLAAVVKDLALGLYDRGALSDEILSHHSPFGQGLIKRCLPKLVG